MRYVRYVQEHWLIAFPASTGLHETRATAFDLNLAASLLLDVLHVGTALSDDLSAEVEARDRFEIDRDALLGPFAL